MKALLITLAAGMLMAAPALANSPGQDFGPSKPKMPNAKTASPSEVQSWNQPGSPSSGITLGKAHHPEQQSSQAAQPQQKRD